MNNGECRIRSEGSGHVIVRAMNFFFKNFSDFFNFLTIILFYFIFPDYLKKCEKSRSVEFPHHTSDKGAC